MYVYGNVFVPVTQGRISSKESDLITGGEMMWVKISVIYNRALCIRGFIVTHVYKAEGLEFNKSAVCFRSRKSSETLLVECIHELHQTTEHGIQTDAVVMDFSKAFDKLGVSKQIIIQTTTLWNH